MGLEVKKEKKNTKLKVPQHAYIKQKENLKNTRHYTL